MNKRKTEDLSEKLSEPSTPMNDVSIEWSLKRGKELEVWSSMMLFVWTITRIFSDSLFNFSNGDYILTWKDATDEEFQIKFEDKNSVAVMTKRTYERNVVPIQNSLRASWTLKLLNVILLMLLLAPGCLATCNENDSAVGKSILLGSDDGDISLFYCGTSEECSSCVDPDLCPTCPCEMRNFTLQNSFKCKPSQNFNFDPFAFSSAKRDKEVLTPLETVNDFASKFVVCGERNFMLRKDDEIPDDCHNQKTFIDGKLLGTTDHCLKWWNEDKVEWVENLCWWPYPILITILGLIALYLVLIILSKFLSLFLKVVFLANTMGKACFNISALLVWFALSPFVFSYCLFKVIESRRLRKFSDSWRAWVGTLNSWMFLLKEPTHNVSISLPKSKLDIPSKSASVKSILLTSMLASPGAVSSVCINHAQSYASSITCEKVDPDGRMDKCVVSSSFQVKTSLLGSTCFTLVDQENPELFTDVEINLHNFGYILRPDQFYYTTKTVSLISESQFNCYQSGNCKKDACEGAEDFLPNPYSSTFETSVKSYPGKTSCRRSCQCASCHGCFYCVPSCVWSRYAFKPNGESYKVWSYGSKSMFYQIELKVDSYSEGSKSYFVNSEEEVNEDISTSITGTFLPSVPNPPYPHICQSGTKYSFCDASKINEPTCGRLGMIQSNTQLTSNSKNFIYDDSCVSSSPSSDQTSYQLSSISPKFVSIPHENPLVKYDFDNIGLKEYYKEASVIFDMSLTGEFSFIRYTERACPDVIMEPKASGKWGDPEGFRLLFSAKSTCGPGTVTVKSDPDFFFKPSIVMLSDEEQTYELISYSASPLVQTTVFVGKYSFNVKKILEDPSNVSDQDTSLIFDEESKPKMATWKLTLIIVASVIGGVLVIGFSTFIIAQVIKFKIVSSFFSKYMKIS